MLRRLYLPLSSIFFFFIFFILYFFKLQRIFPYNIIFFCLLSLFEGIVISCFTLNISWLTTFSILLLLNIMILSLLLYSIYFKEDFTKYGAISFIILILLLSASCIKIFSSIHLRTLLINLAISLIIGVFIIIKLVNIIREKYFSFNL